jgi:hypothetical protein
MMFSWGRQRLRIGRGLVKARDLAGAVLTDLIAKTRRGARKEAKSQKGAQRPRTVAGIIWKNPGLEGSSLWIVGAISIHSRDSRALDEPDSQTDTRSPRPGSVTHFP